MSPTPARGRYRPRLLIAALAGAVLPGCAQGERTREPAALSPASVASSSPAPASSAARTFGSQQRGLVSMYGDQLAGKKTASGEAFDPAALTMAHPTLPFGTRVRVTNVENRRSVVVVVNDRGPFVRGRIADLSEAAARRLGMIADGVVEALLEVLPPR